MWGGAYIWNGVKCEQGYSGGGLIIRGLQYLYNVVIFMLCPRGRLGICRAFDGFLFPHPLEFDQHQSHHLPRN